MVLGQYKKERTRFVEPSYEKRYQDALAEVQQSMANNDTMPARVEYESTNNIKVEGHLGDEWKILGYIKKQKIPKLTSVMRQGEFNAGLRNGQPTN